MAVTSIAYDAEKAVPFWNFNTPALFQGDTLNVPTLIIG